MAYIYVCMCVCMCVCVCVCCENETIELQMYHTGQLFIKTCFYANQNTDGSDESHLWLHIIGFADLKFVLDIKHGVGICFSRDITHCSVHFIWFEHLSHQNLNVRSLFKHRALWSTSSKYLWKEFWKKIYFTLFSNQISVIKWPSCVFAYIYIYIYIYIRKSTWG